MSFLIGYIPTRILTVSFYGSVDLLHSLIGELVGLVREALVMLIVVLLHIVVHEVSVHAGLATYE